MNNKISYLNKTFEDYKNALIEMARNYYPDVFDNFNDAAIGTWLIDMVADVADTLSYNIDKAYQETSMESAQEYKSVYALAKNAGLRIPGPKSAIVEVELSCILPVNTFDTNADLSVADERYAPIVMRGALFSTGAETFELMEDVDFSKQFDDNGISNRTIVSKYDSNGNIVGYIYKKLSVAVAGISKIYSRVLKASDINPFMQIELADDGILNVESILVKDGTNITTTPKFNEFYVDRENFMDRSNRNTNRFFEVDNLIDQYRFGYEDQEVELSDGSVMYNPVWEAIDWITVQNGTETVIEPLRYAMRGKWKRLKNKFITEFKDNGNLVITFGPGLRNQYGEIPNNARLFTQYMMSRMEANDAMGVLPDSNSTIFILYRVGGGESSNIGENTLTNIVSMSMSINGNPQDSNCNVKKSAVRSSFSVTNPTMSYGGKDRPSIEEIKYMTKYYNAAQNRCVTLKDYYSRIMEIHPKYGVPFRISVVEENNKVIVYGLGIDNYGKLSSPLSETVADNIKEYLSQYRTINDFIEIRSGKIVNVAFECDVIIDKTYDKGEVSKSIISTIYDYMDVRKHQMGEDIFIGDLQKDISNLDGVVNLIELRVYSMVGDGYSESQITQQLSNPETCNCNVVSVSLGPNSHQIDLMASDMVLFSESNSMFEILNKNTDIRVNVKSR